MSTPQRCLAQAQDAERLAALVSYGSDRTRLLQRAAEWRSEAAELESAAAAPSHDAQDDPSWLARCSQALFGPRRARGG